MMRKMLLPAATVLFLSSPAAAQEIGCRLRIDAAPSSWIIGGYDPFGDAPTNANFSLIVSNDGDKECEFHPVFELDGEPFGLKGATGRSTPYRLFDLHGGYDATPVAGRTQARATRRSVVVAPKSQQTLQYELIVDGDSVEGAGLHDQRVRMEAQGSEMIALAGRQLVLGIDVLPSATLGLSGAYQSVGGQAVVDLGELKTGMARVPLQLRVQSTGRYKLTLASRNNGRLQLPGTDWSIPYGLALGGQSVELSSGNGEYASPSEKGLRRDSLPFHFRIGDVSDRRAGTYTDVISISVDPL